MQAPRISIQIAAACFICFPLLLASAVSAEAQSVAAGSRVLSPPNGEPGPRSAQYAQVQKHLAQGWNTWDVNSVATQVLLPEGLAIHVGLKHNTTLNGDALLQDALIGRLAPGAEQVTPGPHSWDGSYTDSASPGKGTTGASRARMMRGIWCCW